MKRNDIIGEHKKGVRAIKYNKKPKAHSEPPAPRNPVAKNASAAIGGGAAGAHKDKKKAAKAGEVKHKSQTELAEISLGDYRKKAGMQKAQAGMGAMFARSPEEREKNTATFNKREKGLNRLKARDEKSRKTDHDKQLANLVSRLPELKAEYAQMKDRYKSLGGSNWQYADREQNLTDREREARGMEGTMNNLWRQIQSAEKSQGSSNEGYNPNSVDAEHRRSLEKSHEDSLKKKAAGGDESAKKRLQALHDKKERMRNDYNDRMEREGVEEEAPVAGKISQVTAKDVTIDDPTQGIKITAPISRLVKDPTGKLTLAKPAAGAAVGAAGAQGQQQDKIQAGQPVSIQTDTMEEDAGNIEDLGNGAQKKTNPDGTYEIGDGSGLKLYSADNKLLKIISPSFAGFNQETDVTTGNVTKNYNSGPLKTTQTTDAKGNVVSHNTEYDLGTGVASMGRDAKGITSKSWQGRGEEAQDIISNKDLYAAGNKDKEATYDRAMKQVSTNESDELTAMLRIARLR
jgi:hypothetical protein